MSLIFVSNLWIQSLLSCLIYLCIYQTTNVSSWGHINPLKDGEKIRLNINKNKPIIMANSNKVSILPSSEADNASTSHHSSSSSSSSSSSKAQLLLRPPPAAGSTVHFQSTATNITSDTRSQQKLSQPSTSQPSTSQPSTSQPSTSQPSTSHPSTSHPSTSQPSTSLSTTTIISDSYAVAIEGEEDWSDFTSSWIYIHGETIYHNGWTDGLKEDITGRVLLNNEMNFNFKLVECFFNILYKSPC